MGFTGLFPKLLVAAALIALGGCSEMRTEVSPEDPGAVASPLVSAGCTSNAACDDANVCTSDMCVRIRGVGTCLHGVKIGTTCNDGNVCTKNDRCRAFTGVCLGDAQRNGVACEDGDACSVGTTCSAGKCGGGSETSCEDNNACTAEACYSDTGCEHTPVTCAPSDACHTATCNPSTGCTQVPVVCDDGNDCTADVCLLIAGGRCGFAKVVDGSACKLPSGEGGACVAGQCAPNAF